VASAGPLSVRIVNDADALAEAAADLVISAVHKAERFALVLAGGSTPRATYRLLADPRRRDAIDWSRVDVFFGDERAVAPGAEGSNYRMAREALLDHVPIAESRVHRIRGELPPAEAAVIYDAEIRRVLDDPSSFTMVLLGMGDDGHTASLFPGSPALEEKSRLAAAAEGPPPHRGRVTLTLPALCAANNVVFLVSGGGKAARVAEVLAQLRGEAPATLPAARVRPADGELTWLLDRAAAAHVS